MEISITFGVNLKVLIRVKYRKKLSVNRFNWSFFSTFAQKIISYSSFLIRKSDCYVLEISTSKSIGCGLMQESKDIQLIPRNVHSLDSCGLMQESKDIQRNINTYEQITSCGLMQESKDIQHLYKKYHKPLSCGLMQESKDIQPYGNHLQLQDSCGLMQESKDIQRPTAKPPALIVVV